MYTAFPAMFDLSGDGSLLGEGGRKGRNVACQKEKYLPRPEFSLIAFVAGAGENQGKWFIRQRPQEGLLARMWELPHVQINESDWDR